MERRVFIAIFLAFLVMYVFQTYIAPPPPPPAKTQAAGAPASGAPTAAAGAGTAGSAATTPAVATPAVPAAPVPAAVTGETAEREITVETAKVQAVLTNRGGRLLHWRLKEYLDDRGQPVDLVPSDVPADQPRPLSLRVADADATSRLDTVLYRASVSEGTVDAKTNPATVIFEYQDAAGLHVRKELRFDPQTFIVSVSATVSVGDRVLEPTILWGPGLGDVGATTAGGSFFTGNYVQPPQAIFYSTDRGESPSFVGRLWESVFGSKVTRLTLAEVMQQPDHQQNFRFAGVDDHYFIAAAVNPGRALVTYRDVTLPGANNGQRQLISNAIRVSSTEPVRFFVGPKQFDILRAVDPELVRAINFGMFAWLVIPLLSGLKLVHAVVGNYGGSIIVLTILINLAMFPLRHRSVVSMRKMQAIQPQIKAIQDRYADLKMSDPGQQKKNTEIMNLYREKGVNPVAGCVPMVLTFPVLFAFYSLLQQSIELRGADFGLWIHDLSLHDPYYVTPLLMGATMFWQQRITPTSVDPAQQRMMMIMPVVLTAAFLRFPSGLAIYYLVSNVFQIAQQYFTMWLIGPPVVQAPRPPAERRLKNAGTGKSAGAERKR